MTARKKATGLCVLPGQRQLCKLLSEAHLPDDPKWLSLILYMRSLEYNEALGLSQRASLQKLLLTTLQDGDFSDSKFQTIIRLQERVVTAPYRQKLEAAAAESKALMREFETILTKRCGEVKDLGKNTVDVVESGAAPATMVRRLRKSFRKLVKVMDDDVRNLEEVARTDVLTGLANRRRLDEGLLQTTAQASTQGTALSLLMCDIDNFKTVNDRFGHAVGDLALQMVAEILRSVVQDSAAEDFLCARYGGEEFAVLLSGMDVGDAMVVAERVRVAIEQGRLEIENSLNKELAVTLSIGAAQLDPVWGDVMIDRLIQAADSALFEAKAAGRNRVQVG
ncbi:GGDEF domain-containing protein [Desulfovibrio ferrophilus]|uniref:diguanylate cyclase n=1 Tax=Desulfovibrio ferrophilus TaxID=241368 RepID=A0A2Z6B3E2_9BACT|nr:GGDEF domain-containing protein [Desulfovibrio ferrophilus]BBD09965.1 diguanylate cyclase [Desulfovibrio ferrophilus]